MVSGPRPPRPWPPAAGTWITCPRLCGQEWPGSAALTRSGVAVGTRLRLALASVAGGRGFPDAASAEVRGLHGPRARRHQRRAVGHRVLAGLELRGPHSHAFCVTLDHRQESASLQQTAPRATRGSLAPLPGLPRPCKPGALIRLPARSRGGGGVPLPAGTVGSWPATDTLGSWRLLRHSSCRFSVAAQGGATQGGGFCQQSEGPVASKPHSVMS